MYLLKEIHNNISLFKYSLLEKADCVVPKNTTEIPIMGAGICGSFSSLFIRLAGCLNIPARRVEMYAERDNHVGVEVYYDNNWRFIDVTWKAFFKKIGSAPDNILSIDRVVEDYDPDMLCCDSTSLNYQMYTVVEDPFFYVNSGTRIIKGEVGVEDHQPDLCT
tara:strand:- start:8643 stop:9131 length:489 start_codon:yes stop_codon:yes gene_type:complete